MIRPGDLRLIGLQPTPRPDTTTRKYVVELIDGAWRVTSPLARGALFPDREDAIAFASIKARETAARGAVGLVVVKSGPHELHCFTPDRETA